MRPPVLRTEQACLDNHMFIMGLQPFDLTFSDCMLVDPHTYKGMLLCAESLT